MKRPPIEFRARVDELRVQAARRPHKRDRALVLEALHSPYEGLQSVAAQTLGAWGDRESVPALRELRERIAARNAGWNIQHVVAEALAKCVGAEDAGWLLDLYFDGWPKTGNHLLSAVMGLPVESTRKRFLEESRCPDRERREATMLALGRMPFPDRRALLKRFLEDDDPEIRNTARFFDTPLFPGEK